MLLFISGQLSVQDTISMLPFKHDSHKRIALLVFRLLNLHKTEKGFHIIIGMMASVKCCPELEIV